MAVDNPIIIVPGVFGSTLENFYQVEPKPAWSAATLISAALDQLDPFSLALDASGTLDDSPEVTLRANGLFAGAYARLVAALRQRRSAPVYLFPYDWRRSSGDVAAALQQFLDGVRRKASRLAGWSGRVDFITHSYGGLVFRRYLGLDALAAERIGKVVFIAVPQRGTLDAAEAMIRGKSFLLAQRKTLRKIARSFPCMYELLPRYRQAVVDAQGQDLSLFDIRNWQENVTPHGPDGPEINGFDVTQDRLDAAAAQQASWRSPADVLDANNLLTLYAADTGTTLEQVRQSTSAATRNWFDFDNATLGRGDGVVPLGSVLLGGVASVRLSIDDASPFFETSARVSLHAFMPALDEAQTIVSRFLAGANTPEALLPRNLTPDRYSIPAAEL